MHKEMNITLDQEERILQKKMKDSFSPTEKDLWPAIQRAIAREPAVNEIAARRGMRGSRRLLVTAAALVAVLGLMGAGILRHWCVYNSSGDKTTLAQDEGLLPGGEYAAIKPDMDTSLPAEEDLYFAYDWVENKELIPGGLQIPGRTPEESDIPELKDSLKKLPRGTFVDLQVNGTQYTAIQGFFTEDYETCKNETRDNTLGIRLPDAAAIPADYSEHLSFTVGYYMTDKDYASRKELNSEKTERYALQTWLLPETVKDQIGQYALEWFRTDKKPITCTAHLAATDEMYIPTTDASVTTQPLTVRGFDKALYLEQYNAAFDAQEISVMLWQRIDPVTILTPGYRAAPVPEEKHYIVYILDAVGLTEEEAVRIAEAW
jgi:hypothetical protein